MECGPPTDILYTTVYTLHAWTTVIYTGFIDFTIYQNFDIALILKYIAQCESQILITQVNKKIKYHLPQTVCWDPKGVVHRHCELRDNNKTMHE